MKYITVILYLRGMSHSLGKVSRLPHMRVASGALFLEGRKSHRCIQGSNMRDVLKQKYQTASAELRTPTAALRPDLT
jgi:hypothetical protein